MAPITRHYSPLPHHGFAGHPRADRLRALSRQGGAPELHQRSVGGKIARPWPRFAIHAIAPAIESRNCCGKCFRWPHQRCVQPAIDLEGGPRPTGLCGVVKATFPNSIAAITPGPIDVARGIDNERAHAAIVDREYPDGFAIADERRLAARQPAGAIRGREYRAFRLAHERLGRPRLENVSWQTGGAWHLAGALAAGGGYPGADPLHGAAAVKIGCSRGRPADGEYCGARVYQGSGRGYAMGLRQRIQLLRPARATTKQPTVARANRFPRC